MASGILGAVAPSATTLTAVYTVPASTLASVAITITERGGAAGTFRLALIDSGGVGSVANGDYIAYGQALAANTSASFGGIVLQAAAVVAVYCSSANMSAVVTGFESAV